MKELSAALVAAQAEMPAVAKDSENPHFRNRFVSLDHLIAETRPVLNKHGLAITQFPTVTELGAPALITKLVHQSGESIEYAAPLFLQGQDMQKLGAAITYARRYGWAAALGIASDDDDDGNTASAPAKDKAKQNGSDLITEPQQKRLFAIAKKAEVDEQRLRELMEAVAGVTTSKEIPKAKYDQLCEAVESENLRF